MSDIAYAQVDGWGVVGQVMRLVDCVPAAFLGLDDMSNTATGSGMLVGVAPLDPDDVATITVMSDESHWADRIGTTYWVEDVANGIPGDRYTLRGYTFTNGRVDRLLFHARGLAGQVPTVLEENSQYGIVTEEDHWRFCTIRPELDFYTANPAGARAQISLGTSVPLLPMGRVTRQRWMPILSDFTSTLGARLVLSGGLAPADGMSLTVIRDRDYEDRYSRLFATLIPDTRPQSLQRPLVYRAQDSGGRPWIFTNEQPPLTEDPTDPESRSAIPYHPAKLFGVEGHAVYGERVVRQSFPSTLGLVDQQQTAIEGTDAIVLRRNPVAYYDDIIHTRYPAPSGVARRTNIPYQLLTRAMWTGSELMQVLDLDEAPSAPTINPRRLVVRRGLLNTTRQTHPTQSEWYSETPYISGQRVRLFITDQRIGSVEDRDGYAYTGLAVDVSTDGSQSRMDIELSTDFVSIYATRNAGSETTQAQSITGQVAIEERVEDDAPVRLLPIRPVYADPTGSIGGQYTGQYTCTASLYPADEVYIRLCRSVNNTPVDADWLLSGTNNDLLHARNQYFWRWVTWDGHYVRCSDDYLRYPVWAYSNRANPLPQIPYVHLPQFIMDVYDGGNLAFVAHTPVPWARDRVKDPDTGLWLWGNETQAQDLMDQGLDSGRTNAVVTKSYDQTTWPKVEPIDPNLYNPWNNDQISWIFPAIRSVDETFNGTVYHTILGPVTPTAAISAGTASVVTVDVPSMTPPKYASQTTSLGHVMESANPTWLAWSQAGSRDAITVPVADYGQYIIISPIEAILQFLCSTGTGQNNLRGWTGPGAPELSGLGDAYTNEAVDVVLDVLPAGLGLGIPTDLIDMDSFLSLEFVRRSRGMPYAVRNLTVTSDQASQRVQVLEGILRATYLTLTTDTRGRIRLASSLSTNFAGSIVNLDLSIPSPDSAPACETSVETENIVESVQLSVPRTMLDPDQRTGGTINTIRVRWNPAPRTTPALLRVENENIIDVESDAPVVHPSSSPGPDGLRSTLFKSIQARPTELSVDIEIAGPDYYDRGPDGQGSIQEATNNLWSLPVARYLGRYSRPIQVRTMEVWDDPDKQYQVGDVVVMTLDVFANSTGRENGGPDPTPGIIRQVQVDRFRGVRSYEIVVLLDPIEIITGQRWSAAGTLLTGVVSSTTVTLDGSAYLGDGYADPDQLRGRQIGSNLYFLNDSDVFRVDDVVRVYDAHMTFVAQRTVVGTDPSTNQLTLDGPITAPAGSVVALANQVSQPPDPSPSSAASYFAYQASQGRWRRQ